MSRTSIASVSPGAAPRTAIGPFSGYTRSQFRLSITLVSESGGVWLSLTSRVQTTTVSPESISSTGSLSASQVKWTFSSGKWCVRGTATSIGFDGPATLCDRGAPRQTRFLRAAEKPRHRRANGGVAGAQLDGVARAGDLEQPAARRQRGLGARPWPRRREVALARQKQDWYRSKGLVGR